MQHLSMTTLAVLDDLHDQLCRDVPMIGGEYRLCGAQINALRAALPRLIALERPVSEAYVAAARETTAEPLRMFLPPHDYKPEEPWAWWQRLKAWCRREADELGDICDE